MLGGVRRVGTAFLKFSHATLSHHVHPSLPLIRSIGHPCRSLRHHGTCGSCPIGPSLSADACRLHHYTARADAVVVVVVIMVFPLSFRYSIGTLFP